MPARLLLLAAFVAVMLGRGRPEDVRETVKAAPIGASSLRATVCRLVATCCCSAEIQCASADFDGCRGRGRMTIRTVPLLRLRGAGRQVSRKGGKGGEGTDDGQRGRAGASKTVMAHSSGGDEEVSFSQSHAGGSEGSKGGSGGRRSAKGVVDDEVCLVYVCIYV